MSRDNNTTLACTFSTIFGQYDLVFIIVYCLASLADSESTKNTTKWNLYLRMLWSWMMCMKHCLSKSPSSINLGLIPSCTCISSCPTLRMQKTFREASTPFVHDSNTIRTHGVLVSQSISRATIQQSWERRKYNANVMDLVGKLVSKNNVEIYISGPGLYLLLLKHSIFVGL